MNRRLNVGALILCFCVSSTVVASGAEWEPETNLVVFRSSKSAAYEQEKTVEFKTSIVMREGEIFALYLSTVPGLTCEDVKPKKSSDKDFTLKIVLRMQAPLAPGKAAGPGFMLFSQTGTLIGAAEGFVAVGKVGDRVTGTLALDGAQLKAVGNFSATRCK